MHIIQKETNLPGTEELSLFEYVELIKNADVYDVAIKSPLTQATNLSNKLGCKVFFKREDLQPVFSFKLRGSYLKMKGLSPEQKAAGVIAVSAGNHAQGVALAAKKLGIQATIVMPKGSPKIKWSNVQRLGATVIFHGNDFDEAREEANNLALKLNLTFIHPYDDPLIIAGGGTVGLELLKQYKEDKAFAQTNLECVFVSVGGGGLAAGVSTIFFAESPNVNVYGVNSYDSDSMASSLESKSMVKLNRTGLFADGTSIKIIGKETFRLCSKYLSGGVVRVSNDEICAAIKDVYEDTRCIVEPSGALAVAGLKRYVINRKASGNPLSENSSLVAVLSGANIDFDKLRFVAERARIGEEREALISVSISEKPGNLKRLCNMIKPPNLSIKEISYRYTDLHSADTIIAIETANRAADLKNLEIECAKANFSIQDLSQDELAKNHIRFLIGGRLPSSMTEKVYSFSFPERPGELDNILNFLGSHWNITLFHYRNLGGDIGRILIGMEVSNEDASPTQQIHDLFDFEKELLTFGYRAKEETSNPLYRQFLAGQNDRFPKNNLK